MILWGNNSKAIELIGDFARSGSTSLLLPPACAELSTPFRGIITSLLFFIHGTIAIVVKPVALDTGQITSLWPIGPSSTPALFSVRYLNRNSVKILHVLQSDHLSNGGPLQDHKTPVCDSSVIQAMQ